MSRQERYFQRDLVKELKDLYPGCIVTKLDSAHTQGIPDLLILYEDKWATLECKKDEKTAKADWGKQPNQPYYVEKMNDMSFSRIIFPENKQEVLDELSKTLKPRRKARVSRSK